MNTIVLFSLTLLYLFVLILSMMHPGVDNTLVLLLITYLFILPVKNLVLLQGGEIEFKKLAALFGRLNNRYILFIAFLLVLDLVLAWLLVHFHIRDNSPIFFITVPVTLTLAYMFGKYVHTSQVIAEYTSEYLEDERYSTRTFLYFFGFIIPFLIVGYFSNSGVAKLIALLFVLYIVIGFFGLYGGETREIEVYTILNEELS